MKSPTKNYNWIFGLAILIAGFIAPNSYAYVVPSHFIAEKVTKRKESIETAVLYYQLVRPSGSRKTKGISLWKGAIYFSSTRIVKKSRSKTIDGFDVDDDGTEEEPQTWPLLRLFLETERDRLLDSWKQFGLPAPHEEELITYAPEEIAAAKVAPHPFYRNDESTSLKRLKKKIVYTLQSKDKRRSLSFDKMSFYPLAMQGPCPKSIRQLDWGADENGICSLEFHYNLNRSRFMIPSRTTLLLDGRPIVELKVLKVIVNPDAKVRNNVRKRNAKASFETADEVVPVFISTFLK